MANVTRTYTLVNGQPADATQVNKNFDDLLAGINADVSATDKVLGRATAGAGPVEEIACTAAGRALIDDADAAAQRVTLGAAPAATAVVGPASATDNAIVRFDGVTGKLVQNSLVFIDDAGNLKFRSAGGGVDPLGNLDWGNVGNTAINARISALRGAGNYGQGNLIFSTSPDDSGAVERMRIDMNGAVTVGGQAAVVTNDARLSDARPASDVSAWAKAAAAPCLFACGSYTGNAAHNRAIAAGFQPKVVMVWCVAGGGSARIDAIDGRAIGLNGCYLGSTAVVGLVLSAAGFVTANDDTAPGSCNVDAVVYRWEAWG